MCYAYILSKIVLDERKSLHASIYGLNNQIRIGISKMEENEQECQIIQQCKTQIKANQNYTTKIKVIKSSRVDLEPGEYVTNCSHCNKTCHYPCRISKDCNKYKCAAMNEDGICNVCGCPWQMHYNMPYR